MNVFIQCTYMCVYTRIVLSIFLRNILMIKYLRGKNGMDKFIDYFYYCYYNHCLISNSLKYLYVLCVPHVNEAFKLRRKLFFWVRYSFNKSGYTMLLLQIIDTMNFSPFRSLLSVTFCCHFIRNSNINILIRFKLMINKLRCAFVHR